MQLHEKRLLDADLEDTLKLLKDLPSKQKKKKSLKNSKTLNNNIKIF